MKILFLSYIGSSFIIAESFLFGEPEKFENFQTHQSGSIAVCLYLCLLENLNLDVPKEKRKQKVEGLVIISRLGPLNSQAGPGWK